MNINQTNAAGDLFHHGPLFQPRRMSASRSNSAMHCKLCLPALLLTVLGIVGSAVSASGQSYSIDWSTIDGGGGTSTGGVYAVSGTIGQPDAGNLTGGSYTVIGGFWSVIQQDRVRLKLKRRANSLVLSWPVDQNGFVVQSATQLAPAVANWSTFPGTPIQVGDEFELIIGPVNTPPDPIRFFRLHKP